MAEYAQTSPARRAAAAPARTSSGPALERRAVRAERDVLPAVPEGSPPTAIAQLRSALNRGPRVAGLTDVSATLQRQPAAGVARPSPLQRKTAVIQRKITVGKDTYAKDDKNLIAEITRQVKGQLSTWSERTTINKKEISKALEALKKGTALSEAIAKLFVRYDEGRPFTNLDDLRRQAEQDVILDVVGLPALQGIEQQFDQYHQAGPKGQRGPGADRQPFRIYRCMKRQYWEAYQKSKDVKDILYGHGGALGQALDYFRKSVADKKNMDDVLVEFRFPDMSETQMVDPEQIEKGGEGKAPKGDKLGGKSEKNDIFAPLAAIYSVNLHASKDLIANKKPEVKAIAFSKDEKPGEEQMKSATTDDEGATAPLGPIDVMIRLGRMQPGNLNIMKYDDWPFYYSYKEDHPEFKYADDGD